MKNNLAIAIGLLCAIVVAGTSFGQITNDIPLTNTFEEVDNGASMFDPERLVNGTNGWYWGDTNDLAIVTNIGDYGYTEYPVEGAHTNVMAFETVSASMGISNVFNTAPYLTGSNMFVDIMLKPGRMDPEGNRLIQNVASNSCQVAAYVDTNGILTIWHGVDDGNNGSVNSNRWLTLFTNAFINPVSSSDWVRLTIDFDFTSDGGNYLHYYRIRLNNNDYFTNELAYVTPDVGSGQPGTWFLCAVESQARPYLSALTLGGMGMADDVVIGMGSAGPPSFKIIPSVDVHGTINPSNAIAVPAGWTTNINFTITGDTYWHAANVLTNYVAIGAEFNMNPYVYTGSFSAATLVHGSIKPDRAALGTPHYLLRGLTNLTEGNFDVAETNDPDGDQSITKDEIITGTDPLNRKSYFYIFEKGLGDGSNYIKFFSGTSEGWYTNDYEILTGTNATGGTINFGSDGFAPREEGTTTWWKVEPPTVPHYHKPKASY